MVMLDARQAGMLVALTGRNGIMTLVTLLTVFIAVRWNPLTAVTLALAACWLEIETAFLLNPLFPSPGVLVLPVLLLALGLLLGLPVAFVAACVTVVATIATHLASPAMRTTGVTPDSIYFFVLHAVSMFATWTLLALSLTGLTRVFNAMTANEHDLADTIRFAPDGILVVDQQNRVMLANPAAEALLGLPRDRLIGRPIAAALAAVDGRRDQLDAVASEQGQTPIELHLVARGDAQARVEATWRGMEGGRRQLLLRDVSERVRAEAERRDMELQLSHAQRLDAVGRLAGGLSHDFNNILTAVSGSAEMLRIEQNPQERNELLDEIIAARDRGAALTRQLLAFARREVTQPRVFELSAHIRGMERLLQRVAGDRLLLRLELSPDSRVRVDPGQLEQALVNLVSNARDAMPNGGWCTISVVQIVTGEGARRILLHVADAGVGMTRDVLSRAFEPFFTTKARGQGTGLGLASVHGMAEQSDGSVRIESTAGEGTRVTIELPAVSEPPTPAEPTLMTPTPHTGPRSILVAEDDSGTRRVVERILRHAGFSVTTAADGSEAMALLTSVVIPFDVVLTDVMMPGYTGLEIADHLRARYPGTPVLLMTGYNEEQPGDLMGDRTERDVITKPFSGSELLARITGLFRAPTHV
jgi:PAS domain S-box-containing protein